VAFTTDVTRREGKVPGIAASPARRPSAQTPTTESYFRNFDVVLSARTLPPVWHVGQ
jgi:hypothetical protein